MISNIINIFFITFLVMLSACSAPLYLKPYEAPVGAPPNYKLGWEHGCKSGLSAYGTNLHKTFYKFEQDVSKVNDPTYFKAWIDSFNYCRAYTNRYLAGYSFAQSENPAVLSGRNLAIQGYDLRDKKTASTDYGLGFNLFQGADLPGWGSQAAGSDVPCAADWLNRKPAGCGWMGYGN